MATDARARPFDDREWRFQFDKTLMHVVTRDNVNPIEMVEQ